MSQCVTCGSELHPDRARKYNYCMARECQEKNAKGLTMVAVGVNKAAEQYLILDDHTREELASGKYHDQRRGSFGPIPSSGAEAAPSPAAAAQPVRRQEAPDRRSVKSARRAWSRSQERLALLYNAQGMRPDEIAQKLRLSPYLVTQIILTSRNQGKL
jgi:hypothetical protein